MAIGTRGRHKMALQLLLFMILIFGGSTANVDKGCSQNPADIVFVLDESSSIWGPDFDKQIGFVKHLVKTFSVGKDLIHIGVLTFSTDTRLRFQLQEYLKDDEVLEAMGTINQTRGSTRLDLAIKMTREVYLSDQARQHLPHIAIIITDGGSDYPNKTTEQAQLLKATGVSVFAIGVGREVNTEELNRIATSGEYVFTVDNYSALERLKELIAWKACHVTTVPPTSRLNAITPQQHYPSCQERLVADVVFALPDQANSADTELLLYYIGNLTSGMLIKPTRTLVGLTPRVCSVMDRNSESLDGIKLKAYDTNEALRLRLNSRRLRGTPTSYHLTNLDVFAYAAKNGGRQHAKKAAVIFIDNTASDWQETELQAKTKKKKVPTATLR